MAIKYADWNIEAQTGYKPLTTFYMDFSLAEPFGLSAIQDTYNRAMNEWKTNYKYLTELCMVLNWKIWEHYARHNGKLQDKYQKLWEKCDSYCTSHLKGEELKYFYRTTD